VAQRVWLGIENRLAVCSAETGEKLGEWDVPNNHLVNHLEPIAEGVWVCSKSIHVWHVEADSVELADQLEAHGNKITCATTEGNHIWTGSYDNSIICWDIQVV
jgi:WD40 repeat protein